MDCWHTQLRLVHQYFPHVQLRSHRTYDLANGKVFVYLKNQFRTRRCPPEVVDGFRSRGYVIISIEEPQT